MEIGDNLKVTALPSGNFDLDTESLRVRSMALNVRREAERGAECVSWVRWKLDEARKSEDAQQVKSRERELAQAEHEVAEAEKLANLAERRAAMFPDAMREEHMMQRATRAHGFRKELSGLAERARKHRDEARKLSGAHFIWE